MKLLICGFMGSGKTTLLNRLKESDLKHKFYELDSEVEKRQGISISQIFKNHGEASFRHSEREVFLELLNRDEDSIIALGGGTLETVCRDISSFSNVITVWLNTPFEECWKRISNCEVRPLVSDGKDAALKLYNTRKAKYGQCDIVLGSDFSIDDLICEIKKVQLLD